MLSKHTRRVALAPALTLAAASAAVAQASGSAQMGMEKGITMASRSPSC